MPDLEFCEVCSENPFKYRCPHCELKYCSISCFKSHIATHDASILPDSSTPEAQAEVHESTIETVLRPAPTAPEPSAATPFVRLRDDPRLLALFTTYPDLKSQLRQVYNMTISPDNPGALLTDEDQDQEESDRKLNERQQRGPPRHSGPWSRERADTSAVTRLLKLRSENAGVAEFLDLARMAHGDGEREKEKEKGDEIVKR